MTLYLKYRPQKIKDLDNKEVREILGRILASKSLPHAFLFSGPRGTGKTSSARILAKAVNCEEREGIEPCGKCSMCEEITKGSAVDVVEIDAASNRGIDEIRLLKERVQLAPLKGQVKVYIIDEVHMLTTEAANALLKTLEEPPDKVFFVLCTTEPERLPETVVSRCVQIKFSKPSVEELVEKLKSVARSEKMEVEVKDLELVAKESRGSFRDAIKILEQVKMSGGEVKQVLGMLETANPEEFLDMIIEGNNKEALKYITGVVNQGMSIRVFIERCVGWSRERLVEEYMAKRSESERLWLKIIKGLDVAYEQTKTSAVAQLPLELFVMEMGGGSVAGGKKEAIEKPEVKIPQKEAKPMPEVNKMKISDGLVIENTEVVMSPEMVGSVDDLRNRWAEIMKVVKPKNHSVEALLRSTQPVGFDGKRLELEVFYSFHKDKLESEKCRQIVEMAVGEVMGTGPVRLYLKLGSKKDKKGSGDENLQGKVEEDIVLAAEKIFKVDAI